MHVPFVTFLYKEKNTKNVFLSWRKRRKNSQKRKSPANNHGISGISKFSRKLYIFPIFNTTQLQLSIHIAHISTKWNFFVESFRVRWKRGGGEKKKREWRSRATRFVIVFPSQVDLERVRGESREGCGHLSSRHLSERRPGEYRSVNERSPFPLARARAPTTTNPFPVGGSKVSRPWRPDGVRKNGEGHGFRARERMPRRRGSESKGGSLASIKP